MNKLVLRTVVPLILLILWWVTPAGSTSPFWPPLPDILAAFRETWLFERAGSDIVPSLARLLAGLVCAVVTGIGLGAAMGRLPLLDAALAPLIRFCRAVPGPALVPVAVVLLGIGDTSKIAVIAFVSIFPVLLNTVDAVRGLDPHWDDVARSYRLSTRQRVTAVYLPAAAPQIAVGIRTGLGIAFIMIVITELYAATNGVGFVTLTARNAFDVPQMWAGTVLLGLLGVALNGLFLILERRVLRRHLAMTTERN
ncbi:ABC transporter permease [Nocardia carnea]|uniref:ABC transporter permease n=1 Tax=Nocardia carnea TaxID=37328 RepID=UPI0024550158|nr:ABC transporter permease [Nocardia carnea]